MRKVTPAQVWQLDWQNQGKCGRRRLGARDLPAGRIALARLARKDGRSLRVLISP